MYNQRKTFEEITTNEYNERKKIFNLYNFTFI